LIRRQWPLHFCVDARTQRWRTARTTPIIIVRITRYVWRRISAVAFQLKNIQQNTHKRKDEKMNGCETQSSNNHQKNKQDKTIVFSSSFWLRDVLRKIVFAFLMLNVPQNRGRAMGAGKKMGKFLGSILTQCNYLFNNCVYIHIAIIIILPFHLNVKYLFHYLFSFVRLSNVRLSAILLCDFETIPAENLNYKIN
jgi:hypothetical protein